MTRPWRILRALLLCRPAARLPAEEWRHLRYAVLVRDDHQCVMRRWLGWGRICGRPAEHVDHLVPKAYGGSDDYPNLRAACAAHNLAKGARPPLGWLLKRIARQSALYAALAYFGATAYVALPDAPAPAIAAPEGRWAVVAPGGAVVARFDAEADARRAAAGWNAAGGAGQLGIAEIPVSP